MQGIDWGAQLLDSAIILVTFLLLMAFLNAVVFKPVLKLLEERETRTHGAVAEAKALEGDARAAMAAYEVRLAAARAAAAAESASLRRRIAEEERGILDRARDDAARRVEQIEREVAQAAERARDSLGREAREMARAIAEKVLGRPVSVGAFLLVLLAPGPAAAATAGGGGFFSTPFGAFVAHLINFLILLWLLKRFVGPHLSRYLADRRATLEKTLNEAAALKADAEARAREYRERLARVDSEIERIAEQYRADSEAERRRVLLEAEHAAERVRRAAEQVAAQELAKARVALREEAARLATDLAERALRREVTPADQARLVQEFISRLPAASANGGRG